MKIDGKAIAQNILDDLRKRVDRLKNKGITPHLAIILIGDDPASKAYVKQKVQKGEAIGVKVTVKNYELRITNYELRKAVDQLNNDKNVHGIIVQRPLPEHIDEQVISEAVDPQKDIDGFHPQTTFDMPLAAAVLKILEHVYSSNNKFTNWILSQNIVVLGKGKTGGGPVIKAFRNLGLEPIIIDSKTQNPKLITKTADILISAAGKPNMVKPNAIKRGVILISIGLYKGPDGKLHGDYNEEEIKNIASYYTPTPGGVGPVNVAMLLENVVKAVEKRLSM